MPTQYSWKSKLQTARYGCRIVKRIQIQHFTSMRIGIRVSMTKI